jgi:hypothetical protein
VGSSRLSVHASLNNLRDDSAQRASMRASGWEFGTDEDPREKAEKDYKGRVNSVPADDRADCTFIFVTPRNWSGKTEWAPKKNESGDWRAVRAFDASDLEQWLEESIPESDQS